MGPGRVRRTATMAVAAGLLRARTAAGSQKARPQAALDLGCPQAALDLGCPQAALDLGCPTAKTAAGLRKATMAAAGPGPGPAFGLGPVEAAGSYRPFQGGAHGRALRLGDAPKAVKVHGNASGEVSAWPIAGKTWSRTCSAAGSRVRRFRLVANLGMMNAWTANGIASSQSASKRSVIWLKEDQNRSRRSGHAPTM